MTSAQGVQLTKIMLYMLRSCVPPSQQGFASYMAGTDNPPEYNGYLCALYKSRFCSKCQR